MAGKEGVEEMAEDEVKEMEAEKVEMEGGEEGGKEA